MLTMLPVHWLAAAVAVLAVAAIAWWFHFGAEGGA
jgi:hypothetical protein